MPQVVGVLVTTEAATADVVSIGVDNLVIAHVVARLVAERRTHQTEEAIAFSGLIAATCKHMSLSILISFHMTLAL